MTDSKSGYSEQHRSGTAMILAQICMERLGGKVQEQTMEWLELAASLGHFMAKSVIYRVAKALGSYENKKNTVFPYLTESAGAGIAMAIDDLLEVDGYEGELALKKLEQKRRNYCKPYCFLVKVLVLTFSQALRSMFPLKLHCQIHWIL